MHDRDVPARTQYGTYLQQHAYSKRTTQDALRRTTGQGLITRPRHREQDSTIRIVMVVWFPAGTRRRHKCLVCRCFNLRLDRFPSGVIHLLYTLTIPNRIGTPSGWKREEIGAPS